MAPPAESPKTIAAALRTGGVHAKVGLRFLHAAPHPKGHDRQRGAHGERYAPSPGSHLRSAEHMLQHYQQQQCRQLTADLGDIDEARPEAAIAARSHLRQVSGADAVLAAEGQTLE